MEYIESIMFWSGVSLWIVIAIASLSVFGENIGLNVPTVQNLGFCRIFRFGIGEFALIEDRIAAERLSGVGFKVHKYRKEEAWWMCKIFRWHL